MTVHHFLAASKELPTGDFRMSPKIKAVKEEAYAISVFKASGYENALKHKFRNPFVYQLLCPVIDLKTLHFKNKDGNFKLDEKSYIVELSERFWFREKQYVMVSKY